MMNNKLLEKISTVFFILSIIFVVYMPLHVFIAQSASLLTGGLEIWKAAKDVLLVLLAPLLLYVAWQRGLFVNKTFRIIMILGAAYSLLHLLFVIFDRNDDTYSTIVASVYNARLLGFLLLGYVVGVARDGKRYMRWLLTFVVLISGLVALFGVAQYFLPADLLTNVGYSVERGVKPLFFIDDRPELPRVMSTLRDPNSLGAYLIVPTLLVAFALIKKSVNDKLFIRPFRRGVLAVMLALMLLAQFFTFSRGALIGLLLSSVTILSIVTGERVVGWMRRYWFVPIVAGSIFAVCIIGFRNSAFVQDYVFHAAVSTNDADPNEKRVQLQQQALEDIIEQPEGYGPGRAGLVSISNPKGGLLTENYYLQIAYEVGWIGLLLFLSILAIVGYQLFRLARKQPLAAVLFSSLVGYVFYSLLIHLWSNEAIALQWWLLAGTMLGNSLQK